MANSSLLSDPQMLSAKQMLAAPAISSDDKMWVLAIGGIALAALVFAFILSKQVLAADQGTENARDREGGTGGAAAYLSRQFRTLAIFSLIVFGLLLALPVNEGGFKIQLGRHCSSFVGAAFSATVGYIGMTLARARMCVWRCGAWWRTSAASSSHSVPAASSACSPSVSGSSVPASCCTSTTRTRRLCWKVSASVVLCSPCSCELRWHLHQGCRRRR